MPEQAKCEYMHMFASFVIIGVERQEKIELKR